MQMILNPGFKSKYFVAFGESLMVGCILSDALTIEISCLWMIRNYFQLR
jgi:hypothetical protein